MKNDDSATSPRAPNQGQIPARVGHIVCPLDYRTPSERALGYAATLANSLSVSLTLVYVYEEPSFASSTEPPLETTTSRRDREAAQHELERHAKQWQPRVSRELRTRFVDVLDVPVADAIVSTLGEFDDPLIVMSTHARSGIKRLVLGSVTEALLRKSHVPVLAVPPDEA